MLSALQIWWERLENNSRSRNVSSSTGSKCGYAVKLDTLNGNGKEIHLAMVGLFSLHENSIKSGKQFQYRAN